MDTRKEDSNVTNLFVDKSYDIIKDKLYENRIILIDDTIDADMVMTICNSMILWDIEDKDLPKEKKKTIVLQINSLGGCLITGNSLIDTINSISVPVTTINMGMAYSMAGILMLAGDKRYSLPNSSFLFHYGYASIDGRSAKKYVEKLQEITDKFIVEKTNLSLDEYKDRADDEWYIFPQEAKSEHGMIDGIIGEDITLAKAMGYE